MGLKWVITGGCGFIGTSLVRRLLSASGHSITVVDNLSVGTEQDLRAVCAQYSRGNDGFSKDSGRPPDCTLVAGDIMDEQLAEAVTKDADVVVHLAANTGVAPSVHDPRSDCLTNVIGTFNYLEAARKNSVPRFVFASSGAPLGAVEPPIHEELAPHPLSPYGASKLAGEGYCSAFFHSYGLSTVALRFGNVYGPRSKHKSSIIAKFITQILQGTTLHIYGDGAQTRDFIFIDDLLDAVVASVQKENIGGETFQIATGSETTVARITAELLDIFAEKGISAPPVVYDEPRVGDAKRNFSNTSKAKRVLHWEAKTPRRLGLEQTVDWFIAHDSPIGRP